MKKRKLAIGLTAVALVLPIALSAIQLEGDIDEGTWIRSSTNDCPREEGDGPVCVEWFNHMAAASFFSCCLQETDIGSHAPNLCQSFRISSKHAVH